MDHELRRKRYYRIYIGLSPTGSWRVHTPVRIDENEAHLRAGWLIQNGFSFFLDLTESGEYGLEPYAPLLLLMMADNEDTVTHKRIPVRDMDTPTREEMVQILDTIDAALESGHRFTCTATAGSVAQEPWLAATWSVME